LQERPAKYIVIPDLNVVHKISILLKMDAFLWLGFSNPLNQNLWIIGKFLVQEHLIVVTKKNEEKF